MKPNVIIEQRAVRDTDSYGQPRRVAAVVAIDGQAFTSEQPRSTREAIEINTAIERLVEAVKP